jgi:PST family polysaccharide transporter
VGVTSPVVTRPERPVDLRAVTTTGLGWVAVAQLGRQVLQFVSYAVLARLLVPADFGLMAMAVVFSGFIFLVGELGFEAALVQADDLRPGDLDAVFRVGLAVNIALAATLFVVAEPISRLYGVPELETLLQVLCVSFPLAAIGIVPRALAVRTFDFRALAVAEVAGALTGCTAAVLAAVSGAGAFALVVDTVVAAGCMSAVAMTRSSWRPGRGAGIRDARRFGRFSRNVVGFNALNYWARNADNLLVGRVLGSTALGFYERGYLTVLFPVSQISHAIGRVMFPSLATIKHDRERTQRVYLSCVATISLVVAPLMLILGGLADSFVLTVFGPLWLPAAPVVRILAVASVVQAIATTVGWIYQAQGRTGLYFAWGSFAAGVIMLSFGAGLALGGITAVAAAYAVTSCVILIYPTISIPCRLIGLRFVDVARAVHRPILAGAAAAVAAHLLGERVLGDAAAAFRLVSGSLTGLLVYAGLIVWSREPALEAARRALAAARTRRPEGVM